MSGVICQVSGIDCSGVTGRVAPVAARRAVLLPGASVVADANLRLGRKCPDLAAAPAATSCFMRLFLVIERSDIIKYPSI